MVIEFLLNKIDKAFKDNDQRFLMAYYNNAHFHRMFEVANEISYFKKINPNKDIIMLLNIIETLISMYEMINKLESEKKKQELKEDTKYGLSIHKYGNTEGALSMHHKDNDEGKLSLEKKYKIKE